MKGLQNNWSLLLESNSIEQEATRIESLRSDFKRLDGYFDIYLTDSLGQRIHYNDFNWGKAFVSIDIELFIQSQRITFTGWKPISKDNVFILVLE